MRCFFALLLALGAALAGCVRAQSPVQVPVTFTHTFDTGFGNDLFVLGDHPDLGANVPERALKLTYTPGNVWTGQVALEAGATVTYRFISRSIQRAAYCNYNTFSEVTTPQTLTVPGGSPAPYRGKVIWYHSSWSRAFLLYRNNTAGSGFQDVEMRRLGNGRVPGESLYRIDLTAEKAGSELEFVFHNELNQYDNAPAPPSNAPQGAAPGVPYPYQSLAPPYNYRTQLDHLFVQDGGVFNYRPTATVSLARLETRTVSSSYAGIPGRTIRLYLPRGYDTNPTRRYPVVYFHDGQNMFFPGGSFGTWDADRIASYEIGQGRMREAILVGIDNTANRLGEYSPPSDQVPLAPPGTIGQADQYGLFLLNNVIPTLTANYRTLTASGGAVDPAETTIAGSSMGGLVSSYLASLYPTYFRRSGVFSPAFWAAPNHVQSLKVAPKRPVRWWLSIGTEETSSGGNADVYWNGAQEIFNAWLSQGYAHLTELRFAPGCGAAHNEPAWSRLLPAFFQFHLGSWDEANALTAEEATPGLRVTAAAPGATSQLTFTALRGVTYQLERGPLTGLAPWAPLGTFRQRDQAWAPLPLADTATPPAPDVFWRLRY
ncbi:MAG: hypothetical protein JSR82_08930 [Verrucomicrobia bacterium]|nr:hypothetical protein [Verrucomicrobiota bacterium]